TDGTVAVDYSIHEDNPDLFTLRGDYHAVGQKDWIPLQFEPRLPTGRITWNPSINGPWEIRVQLRDKAGNAGEQIANVTPPGAWRPNPDRTTGPTNPTVRDVTFVKSLEFSLNCKLADVGKSGVRSIDVYSIDEVNRTVPQLLLQHREL